MLRVSDDALSEAGFPFVYWEQEVPTGQSLHSVQQSMDLKIAAVIMVFVFVAVYAWSEQFWGAVIAAMIVGGMGLSGDKMFKGGVKVWDIHIPGPEPRDTAEADRRAKATAILGKQYRGLEVVPDDDSLELYLCVAHGPDRKAMEWLQWAPLASIQSLELGTAEEWFGSLAEAELRRMGSAPNSWVIVAPTLGHGVLRIAESAGSKAGIAALHGVLTKRFVVDAPETLARWKEKLEEEMLEQEMLEQELLAQRESAIAEPNGQQAREGEAEAASAAGAGEGSDAAGAHDREK